MPKQVRSILDKKVTPDIPIATERALIEALSRSNFLTWLPEPVSIHSRMETRLLVGGRSDITDNRWILDGLARIIASTAWTLALPRARGRTQCLIGVPTAGTALAVAAARYGDYACPVRIMREQLKEDYGASNGWLDGVPEEHHWYITVDNTITRGGSLLKAITRLKEDGYPTKDMGHITLVDREQGGIDILKQLGVTVTPIFKITDLLDAFNLVNPARWTSEIVAAAKNDLKCGMERLDPLFA